MQEVLEKTDLDSVKKIAHLFMDMDLEVGPFGLVRHPFFNSTIVPKIKNGETIMAKKTYASGEDHDVPAIWDLTKHEDLAEAKEEMHKVIDRIKSYSYFQIIMNKCYASAFFKYTYEYLDAQDFADALIHLFTALEYPNKDANFTLTELVKLFRRVPQEMLMDQDEREHIDSLPDEITIYRGVKPKGKVRAMSWTDKLETAQWFADRFEKNGTVYQAKINKKDVLTYTDGRGESELIVNFRKLKDIKEL